MAIQATRSDIIVSVAFTGYRPLKLHFGDDWTHPDAIRLRAALKAEYERLYQLGYRQFLTGGALGCDLMAAEVILELKEEHGGRKSGISHVLCLPCYHYTSKWPEDQRERLKKIAKHSMVDFISAREYYNGCMQVRNRHMVDNSAMLLAIYDGQKGGTRNTVEYAQKVGKDVIALQPKDLMRITLISSDKSGMLY